MLERLLSAGPFPGEGQSVQYPLWLVGWSLVATSLPSAAMADHYDDDYGMHPDAWALSIFNGESPMNTLHV